MTRVSAWLMVVLLFGAFLSVVGYALWQRAEAGKGMPAFSVYSEERDGLAGAAPAAPTGLGTCGPHSTSP